MDEAKKESLRVAHTGAGDMAVHMTTGLGEILAEGRITEQEHAALKLGVSILGAVIDTLYGMLLEDSEVPPDFTPDPGDEPIEDDRINTGHIVNGIPVWDLTCDVPADRWFRAHKDNIYRAASIDHQDMVGWTTWWTDNRPSDPEAPDSVRLGQEHLLPADSVLRYATADARRTSGPVTDFLKVPPPPEPDSPIVTKTGKVLTDDDVQKLADEAETRTDWPGLAPDAVNVEDGVVYETKIPPEDTDEPDAPPSPMIIRDEEVRSRADHLVVATAWWRMGEESSEGPIWIAVNEDKARLHMKWWQDEWGKVDVIEQCQYPIHDLPPTGVLRFMCPDGNARSVDVGMVRMMERLKVPPMPAEPSIPYLAPDGVLPGTEPASDDQPRRSFDGLTVRSVFVEARQAEEREALVNEWLMAHPHVGALLLITMGREELANVISGKPITISLTDFTTLLYALVALLAAGTADAGGG